MLEDVPQISYIAPMKPVYIGLLAKGTEYATMIKAPLKIPAEPRMRVSTALYHGIIMYDLPKPATARPTISAVEFGATPQIREPNSKTKIAPKYTHLMEKKV